DGNRWAIVGDVLAELQRPADPLGQFSRWSAWEAAVLSRVGDPAGCQRIVVERQGAMDADQAEADVVREGIVSDLRARRHDPLLGPAWTPCTSMAEMGHRATGEKRPTNQVSAYLGPTEVPNERRPHPRLPRHRPRRGSRPAGGDVRLLHLAGDR